MGSSVLPELVERRLRRPDIEHHQFVFGPNAAWYECPAGLPAPGFFDNLMHSSFYCRRLGGKCSIEVKLLYRIAYSRDASAKEVQQSLDFLKSRGGRAAQS